MNNLFMFSSVLLDYSDNQDSDVITVQNDIFDVQIGAFFLCILLCFGFMFLVNQKNKRNKHVKNKENIAEPVKENPKNTTNSTKEASQNRIKVNKKTEQFVKFILIFSGEFDKEDEIKSVESKIQNSLNSFKKNIKYETCTTIPKPNEDSDLTKIINSTESFRKELNIISPGNIYYNKQFYPENKILNKLIGNPEEIEKVIILRIFKDPNTDNQITNSAISKLGEYIDSKLAMSCFVNKHAFYPSKIYYLTSFSLEETNESLTQNLQRLLDNTNTNLQK